MTVIDYFQSHAAGIAALVAVLTFAWGFLWSAFKVAVERVTKQRFDTIDQRFNQVDQQFNDLKSEGKDRDKEIALLKLGQERIISDIGDIKRLLEEIAPRKAKR